MRQFLRYQNAQNWEEIRHILRILISAFALWVLVWMVSRNIVGDSWRTIRMGNFLTIWMVLALLLAVFVALWLQHRWLTIGLVVLLSVSAYQNQLWVIAVAEPVVFEVEEDDLRIMTFNVHPTNAQIDRVADLILTHDLDVVALQEISEEAKDELAALYLLTLGTISNLSLQKSQINKCMFAQLFARGREGNMPAYAYVIIK